MNKKLIVVCLALAIAVWSVPVRADKVIGTWEPSDACNGDGWIDWGTGSFISPFPRTLSGTTYDNSTIGGTEDGHSLKVTVTGAWQQNLAVHNYQDTLNVSMADLLSHTAFAIDVTYDSGSWPSTTSYAQVYELSMQTGTYGWNDVGGAGASTGKNGVKFIDTLNPGSPGNLPLVNVGTPGTTLTGEWIWDYSAILPGGSWTGSHISTADTYFNFIFALNENSGGAGGSFYFDNARLAPEPATIVLLSLGGLALLRRKRA
jgi:hypothetical protein